MRSRCFACLAACVALFGTVACGALDEVPTEDLFARVHGSKHQPQPECSHPEDDDDAEGGGSIIINGLSGSTLRKKAPECE